MKRILSIISFFSLCSLLAYAYDFEVDGNYYTLISTSERTVAFSGTANKGDITIPAIVQISNKEFKVTGITSFSFRGQNTGIKSIFIPESINSLDSYSMAGGDYEEVFLPKSLRYIKDYAFSGCINLRSVEIPDNVINIGSDAFVGCVSLTKIKLPDSECSLNGGSFQSGPKPSGCLVIPGELKFHYGPSYEKGYVVFDDCSMVDSLVFEDGYSSLTLETGKLHVYGSPLSSE